MVEQSVLEGVIGAAFQELRRRLRDRSARDESELPALSKRAVDL